MSPYKSFVNIYIMTFSLSKLKLETKGSLILIGKNNSNINSIEKFQKEYFKSKDSYHNRQEASCSKNYYMING